MQDNPERVTYFAATDSRGKKVPFGIKAEDRGRHMYVIGKTGMGKSTLLENMAIQDIRNGEGMCFIDPHGSAIEKLLDFIPPERVKDVVYFAPFDLEHPMAFNIMEDVGYDKRHLVTSGLMATFKKIWEDAWSARMEYILTNTLLALLEYPDSTLLGVNRMYTDKNYRKKVVDNIKDPVVRSFWVDEYAKYTDKFAAEATPAIQNKIGQFTSNPLIRNIIGQPKSSFDIRTLMDERKILLINLSKGLVGDVNMRLLGSMLTTRIFLGAMSRAELPPHELKKTPKFYFYVDEFQNFANDTFAEILSEARKYNLNLIIAHQYVEQMEEEVRAAVFGNVGTTITFRVGPFDAETLETVFFPKFLKEDLVNLGFAQVYMTLMIDGQGSQPFSAVTLPPIEPPARSYRQEVIDSSRQQFGAARAGVEGLIFGELLAAAEASAGESAPAAARKYPPRAPSGDDRPRPQPSERRDAPRPSVQQSSNERRVEERGPRPDDRRPRQEDRRPRPDERPQPQAAAKTAEDLKAILRSTLKTNDAQKGKKDDEKQHSLKDALAHMVAKQPHAPQNQRPEPPSLPRTPLQALPHKEAPSRERNEAREPRKERVEERLDRNDRVTAPPAPQAVFEVPEDVLRGIFKETL